MNPRPPRDAPNQPHDAPDRRLPAGVAVPPAVATHRPDEPAGAGPRHRLHPLTPVLRGLRSLAVVIAIISWQGYAQLGPTRWVAVVTLLLLTSIVVAVVSWLFTGYQVIGRELRISEGLLWRRTRAIPLERLQAVDLVRPLLARLAGLAELRLEVVGASRAEAPLSYLSMAEAHRLRARLLALAGLDAHTSRAAAAAGAHPATHTAADAAPDTAPDTYAVAGGTAATGTGGYDTAGARVVHVVDNRQVLLGQLLTPAAWLVPVMLLITVVEYAQQLRWTFVAVGSVLTALIGVLQAPLRRTLDQWNFRIGSDHTGLRLRHGLLDTRSQTVPPERVQAVGVSWPPMWRPLNWVSCRIDVAGYGEHDRSAMRAGLLLPVADEDTARRVVADVLGQDFARLPLAPPPARARWLAPLRQPVLAIGFSSDVIATRDGWLHRRLVVARMARVQSVRVTQGPVQRALRLATVHVDTAGGLHVVGHHRDAAEAYALAVTLSGASRVARGRSRPADRALHHRSAAPTTTNVTTT